MKKLVPLGQQLLAVFLSFALLFSSVTPAMAGKTPQKKSKKPATQQQVQGKTKKKTQASKGGKSGVTKQKNQVVTKKGTNTGNTRNTSSTSQEAKCPVKQADPIIQKMFNNPSDKSLWGNADNVNKMTEFVRTNPGCFKKYRNVFTEGEKIAGDACIPYREAGNPMNTGVCAASNALSVEMKKTGYWRDCQNQYAPDGTFLRKVCEGEEGYVAHSGSGAGTGTGSVNEGVVERRVEENKPTYFNANNKDGVTAIKLEHADMGMSAGTGAEITGDLKAFYKLLMDVQRNRADLRGIMDEVVSKYLDPMYSPRLDHAFPASYLRILFKVYADRLPDNGFSDIYKYVTYTGHDENTKKWCKSDDEKCNDIHEFAAEALLIQSRFRKGVSASQESVIKSVFSTYRNRFRNNAKMEIGLQQGVLLVGLDEVIERDTPQVKNKIEAYINEHGTINPKDVAYIETKYMLQESSIAKSLGVGLATTTLTEEAIVQQRMFILFEQIAAQTKADIEAQAVLDGVVESTGSTTTSAINSTELVAGYGATTLAEVFACTGIVAGFAAVAVGFNLVLEDCFKDSYPNAVKETKQLIRRKIQEQKFELKPQLKPQAVTSRTDGSSRTSTRVTTAPDPSEHRDPKRRERPKRCDEEVKGRETCEFHFAVASEWELKDIGGWQGKYNGISTPGGINGGDAPSKQRRADLLTCLIQAGVCKGFPETNKKLRSPELFWRQCDGNEYKPLKTIASMAPACARDLMELAEVGRVSKSFRSSRTHRVIDNVRAVYRHGKWIPEPEIGLQLSDWGKVLAQMVIDGLDVHTIINNLIHDVTFDSMTGYGGTARYGEHEQKGLHFHYEEMKLYEGKKDYVCNHTLPLDRTDLNNWFGPSSGYTPCTK